MAIEQAFGVRDCVRPRASKKRARVEFVTLALTTCSHPMSLVPSPPFALLIGKGNVKTFVVDVNERPAGEVAEARVSGNPTGLPG